MARIDLIRDAQRPKMAARALFKGPQGSGKTWTLLSVARYLTLGTDATVTLIDTERESALTYADVFTFKHLPWRAPYDTAELTQTLAAFDERCTSDDVLIIDSLSHFWQGAGGILDIANGRVQGGWDKARPIQNALIEQLLAMRCHVLLGARMKNTVQVSNGGKTVETIGLQITQDDALEYELNIVVQMDSTDHSATVTKSRTTAVPVGRVFPGGMEKKLAEDYAEWLAGGIPPANRDDVDRIVAIFGGIVDKEQRGNLKQAFVEAFGMPQSLPAVAVPDALAWLADHGAPAGEGPSATAPQPTGSPTAVSGSNDPPKPAESPDQADSDHSADSEGTDDGDPRRDPAYQVAVERWVADLDSVKVNAQLLARNIIPEKKGPTGMRHALINAIIAAGEVPDGMVLAPTE